MKSSIFTLPFILKVFVLFALVGLVIYRLPIERQLVGNKIPARVPIALKNKTGN
ncbi:MAG: hypothetical protein F6K19_26615 [Cyanothece sp. SIO1E1]|nr:hypothetical protein [Cyanothece sp. SIO1E1]